MNPITKFITLILVMATLLFTSCSYNKKVAIKTTNDFFTAVKYDNEHRMNELYPDIKNLGSYWKSDRIEIIKIKQLKHKEYLFLIKNYYTNGVGNTFNKEIALYLKRKPGNYEQYIIYDSENFCSTYNPDDDVYYYAQRIGCINRETDKRDQIIAKKMQDAYSMYIIEAVKLSIEIKSKIIVSNFHWERNYWGYGANGRAIFSNLSGFDLPNTKYEVTYYSRKDGDIVATDNGYVSYDTFYNYTSKSVSFYSSYAGGARYAYIEPVIDDTALKKYICREKPYSGNEYREYLKTKQ